MRLINSSLVGLDDVQDVQSIRQIKAGLALEAFLN